MHQVIWRIVLEEVRMRIVQVAPNIFPLPPDYGGIERVVYDLTEELVSRGEEVFLYAPKGTKTSAHLLAYPHSGIWNNNYQIIQYVKRTLPRNIDIIHDHTHYSVIGKKRLRVPTVCTVHMPTTAKVKYPIYVSEAALKVYGNNSGDYVHNGLNLNDFEFSAKKKDYLLFLGRISKDKGTHLAVEVAERTGQKLIVAGPNFETDFFDSVLKSKLQGNQNIEYIGEVGGKRKQELLKNAKCLLFPSIWDEPFGLAMIEAMSCGTPVLALNNGAAPEVLKRFPSLVCQSTDEMVDKVNLNQFPSPILLHKYIVENFTREIMADNYLRIYKRVAKR